MNLKANFFAGLETINQSQINPKIKIGINPCRLMIKASIKAVLSSSHNIVKSHEENHKGTHHNCKK